jgi:hypothetical protein
MDIVCVPIQVRDRSVVLPGIKHDQIGEVAKLERAPDAQVVVHLHLADWHPLEVGANGIHLPLVDRDATIFDERVLGIVQLGRSVPIGIICNLVVIPNWDPWKSLVAGEKIQVSPVGGKTLPVVIETEDLLVREGHSADTLAIAVVPIFVFIDVVSQVDNVVDRVFACSIAVCVEETKGKV